MKLNGIEILELADNLPTGLWDGKAGLCLYLAESDGETARQLWKKVMQELPQLCGNIDFFHGLTGIVFAAYKLEEKGVELAEVAFQQLTKTKTQDLKMQFLLQVS